MNTTRNTGIKSNDWIDYSLSLIISLSVSLFFLFLNSSLLHWFLIPVVLCGVLIGTDAVRWFRGKVDAFHPVGIIGLIGVHFFFIAPQLHVLWQCWLNYVVPPDDWRLWLGGMAILNSLGLIVYRWSLRIFSDSRLNPSNRFLWTIDQRTFPVVWVLSLFITGILQFFVYLYFGGIGDFISRFEQGERGMLSGMGWLFMISESFPILAIIGVSVLLKDSRFFKSWTVIIVIMVIFFVLKMLFGGLRGSRSNTLWGVFWAAGIIHLWIRPIPKKAILFGIIILTLFMYIYGFYKSIGTQALTAFEGADARARLSQQTGRSFEGTILGDLGRSDIQAFLLYRLYAFPDAYEYSLGRTYLASLAILIPKKVWPDRPPSKVREGTSLQYGEKAYVPGRFQSSRVYGLAGEFMLNFGYYLLPLSFSVLGFATAKIGNIYRSLDPSDSRLLLLPFLIIFLFVLLVSDSDNIVFYFVKNGLIPFLLVFMSSKIQRNLRPI